MDLDKLLRPRKIAIVGASEKETMAGFVTRLSLGLPHGRGNDYYFVSTSNPEVFGRSCYKKLADLPEPVDLAVFCTPKQTVAGLLEEAAQKGAGAAVVFAGGYGETGKPEDQKLEEELKELAERLDIAVMGPNCAGFVNYVDSAAAFGFLCKAYEEPGQIGLISQSGQICMAMMESPKINLSHVISCGNGSIVTAEEYLDFLVEDPSTKVIAVYLEGIHNPEKFALTLKKAALAGKPIVILKAGRSRQGQRAAASHTGNLSGSDQNVEALFKKFGVIRADDLEEMLSICDALVTWKTLPVGDGVAFVNISGGETTISADAASLHHLSMPDFDDDLRARLRAALPDFATAQNPMDLTGGSDGETFYQVADIVLGSPDISILVTSLQITEEISDITIHDFFEGLLKYAQNGNGKPMAIVPLIESGRDLDIARKARAAGIALLPPPHYGYRVIKKIMDYSAFQRDRPARTLEFAFGGSSPGQRRALSERESKDLFKAYGINCVPELLATSADQAAEAAEKFGYPLVLKIESPDIPHKSDIGGVALNIGDEKALRESYDRIMRNARAAAPEGRLNGILIQPMLPPGFEVIVGVNNDPQCGPIVLVGAGGVMTEVLADVALYPAPFTRHEARGMIASLKSHKLFGGYRGGPPLDVEALAEALAAVAKLAVDHRETLAEMDINPLIVYPRGEGVTAVDGLIIMKEASQKEVCHE